IAASLIPVAAILLFFDRRWAIRDGVRAFGPGLAGVAIAYAAIQAVVRATSGAGSYYRLSPALAFRNVSEAGLAFLHIKSDWITPGPLPALAMAAALTPGLILARDAIVRF